MGSGQSVPCAVSLSTGPVSILQCVDTDGECVIDPVKYMQFRRVQEEERRRIASIVHHNNKRALEKELSAPPAKRSRNRGRAVLEYIDDDGIRQPLPPTKSTWYTLYVNNPALNNRRFRKKFRRRFRVPYQQYSELLDDVKQSGRFKRWMSKDALGKDSSPIELLVLGAMRYLGRGLTFDDLEEATAVSEDVHRNFFHRFIDYGNTVLFDRHVKTPSNAEEIESCMHEMKQAGFNGCIGSMDATHVVIERCSARLHQMHKGFKMSHTARTYNMTVNHRRRILSTTRGHPCRWNDKTLVLFDDLARGMKEGRRYQDVEFELLERDSNGSVVAVKYRGAWLLVDNGYLSWPTTMPPTKVSMDRREIRWSQWLESMRKDVECTFGILKGRWRILKTGIRLHGVEAADKIWCTCCALHNWLLEVDGLDCKWDNGVETVSSEWEGPLGECDPEAVRRHAHPAAIERLHSPAAFRDFDLSGMGVGDDCEPSTIQEVVESDEGGVLSSGIRVVRRLSHAFFKRKLIEHFDILYSRKEIVWPSRT